MGKNQVNEMQVKIKWSFWINLEQANQNLSMTYWFQTKDTFSWPATKIIRWNKNVINWKYDSTYWYLWEK